MADDVWTLMVEKQDEAMWHQVKWSSKHSIIWIEVFQKMKEIEVICVTWQFVVSDLTL